MGCCGLRPPEREREIRSRVRVCKLAFDRFCGGIGSEGGRGRLFVEERKEGRMGINANVLGKWRERERVVECWVLEEKKRRKLMDDFLMRDESY